MIDLRLLREEPGAVRPGLRRRGVPEADLDRLLDLDARRRALITQGDGLRARQRLSGKAIGAAAPDERAALIAETSALSGRLAEVEAEQAQVDADVQALLDVLPNVPHPDAPDGGEDDAVEVAQFGDMPELEDPLDHVALAERLGALDLERAVRLSGSRFAFLLGDAVLLQLALVQYALEVLVPEGFVPTVPPVLVRRDALWATGFLPTGEDQIYALEKDELYLTGTSEVALAGLHADEILDPADLPLRYAGLSTCFRREAGTYGKDTHGILRLHQFDKVEMFSFVLPERSWEEHERLRGLQVAIMAGLGLHGRVVDIAVGDLGASAARKYDLEVWLPGQQAYRELTSASNCTDYQARRLRARCRTADGGTAPVHTLNGTAVAIGRTLIALLETHQQPDGSIALPEPLARHLGRERIEPTT